MLAEGPYADRPAPRSNDWGSFVRKPDARLDTRDDGTEAEGTDGGLQQERHPGLGEDKGAQPTEVDPDSVVVEQEDGDIAADQRAMDHARGLTAVARGYGINESSGRDLLPGF